MIKNINEIKKYIQEKYNDSSKIEIFTNECTAKECLIPLLNELKYMGDIGTSRSIKIEDWDENNSFGIDGDGAHKIEKILLDSKECKRKKYNKESKIFNEEKNYNKHCVLINTYDNVSEKSFILSEFMRIQNNIPDNIIYRKMPLTLNKFTGGLYQNNDEEYGLPNSHITVLYGIDNESDYFQLRRMLSNFYPFEVELGEISKFFGYNEKEYDVLKLEIISNKLIELNNLIKNTFNVTLTYSDYIPHMTLAYVKKGKGNEFVGDCKLTGQKFIVNNIKFSHNENYELPLYLKKREQ